MNSCHHVDTWTHSAHLANRLLLRNVLHVDFPTKQPEGDIQMHAENQIQASTSPPCLLNKGVVYQRIWSVQGEGRSR